MLLRFARDLVNGELARLRPGRAPASVPFTAETRFAEDLGADSLERLQLATAFAEAIHLHRSGIDDSLVARATIGEWVEVAAAALDVFSAELTFRTSGSMGRPKWCVHALADLLAEVDVLAGLFGDRRRLFSAVPSHHIYGFLFTILLAQRLGAEVLDVRGHAPSRLAGLARPGDLVVGYPDYWRAFVRAVPRLSPGAVGVTSTAPCPPDTAAAVVASGIDRLVEIYGSSETAGIGWRDDPVADFELFPYWRAGDGEAELLRVLPDGAHRRVAVPDCLVWSDDRHVRPSGRIEGAVQVGGINVFPERVSAMLLTHPGVAAAAVRLMRPDEGERLKAFVVPRDPAADAGALGDELWEWIDARLTAPERPKSIVFGRRLPTGDLGKSADWPIAPDDAAAD
jgi:4-coumarate--CoA ligase (photoactive yellow protein activation family)